MGAGTIGGPHRGCSTFLVYAHAIVQPDGYDYGMSPRHQPRQPACTHCFAPIPKTQHFCSHCGAPATTYATTAPYESIFSEGFAWREASQSPTRLIVVIGMWLLWAPPLLVSLGLTGVAIMAALDAPSPKARIVVLIIGALVGGGVWISATLLYRTTRNYFGNKHLKPLNQSQDH